ncbi:MAG: RNA polymerase sigma factor RpoH [Gammaproteobacteria bacterium]|nr:RNA polymerase sigma factor RpoH [Gammaproteobacteria bacterium]MDH4315758.1 RNA polymerase sigma factor RpoH [Gammaproteobacteria bacterium]MDH5214994.1 RNA polymerase sigma factor RpoH [Gammaproteobacteria bacterium]MDH5501724.1 RNA polymerase sigma factor RpoH [Gammaproteobacteria bacterium]
MSNAVAMSMHNLALTGPVGSLDAYIQAVGGIPVLSKEHEQALARRFREEGDLEAARDLVMAHLRFVVHIAKGYTGYGLPLADLIQEGNVGLMKAVKRFDPSFDVRLVSFAVHWIRAEIHEYVLRNWRIVKVATTKAQRKLFFNLRKAKKSLSWLSHDETQAVAEDLGVSATEVTEMERRLSAYDPEFDPAPDADDDRAFTPAAYLPSPNADPAAILEKSDWQEDATGRMVDALETLDDRSRHILQSRWLDEKKPTLHELAGEYGVSAERIRQIEVNAIRKLKAAMEA